MDVSAGFPPGAFHMEPTACAVGTRGCEFAPVPGCRSSFPWNMTRYSPRLKNEIRGDIEFSLSRFPTAQTLGHWLPALAFAIVRPIYREVSRTRAWRAQPSGPKTAQSPTTATASTSRMKRGSVANRTISTVVLAGR